MCSVQIHSRTRAPATSNSVVLKIARSHNTTCSLPVVRGRSTTLVPCRDLLRHHRTTHTCSAIDFRTMPMLQRRTQTAAQRLMCTGVRTISSTPKWNVMGLPTNEPPVIVSRCHRPTKTGKCQEHCSQREQAAQGPMETRVAEPTLRRAAHEHIAIRGE